MNIGFFHPVYTLASAVPVLEPASKDAHTIGRLFLIVSLICLVIFIVVMALIGTSLWRSRNSGNETPPQNFGSRGVQIAWTAPPVTKPQFRFSRMTGENRNAWVARSLARPRGRFVKSRRARMS